MAKLSWMLDTNILSHLIKAPQGTLVQRLTGIDPDSLCELRFGAQRRGSPALQLKVDDLLENLSVLAFEAEADRHCADIRAVLERAGTPIGSHDLFIAARARWASRWSATTCANSLACLGLRWKTGWCRSDGSGSQTQCRCRTSSNWRAKPCTNSCW